MSQNKKLYVHCPVCGHGLGKSGSGTNTEQNCTKCKSLLSYEVNADGVHVHIIRSSDKKKVS